VTADPLLEEVAACASRTLGFRRDALDPRNVERAARHLRATGSSDRDLVEKCGRHAPEIVDRIVDAVTVDETYFFRTPAQFELVGTIAARLAASGARALRGWSAGCSNGAEAYSLAATLRASVPGEVQTEVLGTDVVARNVDRAARAIYGEASVRDSGPLLFPTLSREGSDWHVAPALRPLVDFAVHNLIEPPPFAARFDFILCRNVLVYMTPDAIECVCHHLLRALAPGGTIVLGAGDLVRLPDALVPAAAPGLAAYQRGRDEAVDAADRDAGVAKIREVTPRAAPRLGAPREVVALHLEALARIERGDDAAADRVLGLLLGLDDGYLPGIVERALLFDRRGDIGTAARLMADVLRRTHHLPAESPIAGPSELPLRFYRQSAEAFLERRRGAR
jgi:chemotaxis protein methyltransferase CheR